MTRAVLVAVLGTVLGACSRGAGDLPFVDVEREDLVIGVGVAGELDAVDATEVRPPPLNGVWNFKIANLAAEGDDVKIGDPVVAFDPSDQVREFEKMNNEADSAQKKLEKKRVDAALARRDDELKIAQAEADLRKASLKAHGSADLVASVDLQILKLDEANAKLVLEGATNHASEAKRSDQQELARLSATADYAKHRVAQLQHNIAAMQIVASRAGTIVMPVNDEGEKRKVGDSVWRMEDVMQIVGLGKMVGVGTIDEVDLARVMAGQPVRLRLDAQPDVELTGTVQEIAKSVEPKSTADPSKVVKLKLAIDKTSVPLRPGMRFRGEVETAKREHVIVVPVDAVFVTPGGPIAYRRHGDRVDRVELQLGKRSATKIEVITGLAPGDRVSRVEPAP